MSAMPISGRCEPARVVTPVWSPADVRVDIAVRLAADGLCIPIAELLTQRADALCEITRLRISLGAAEPKQDASCLARRPEPVQPSGGLELAPGSMLRLPDVCKIFSLSRSSVYTWIAQGRFPPPVHVGGRSVRWAADALVEWRRGLGSATPQGAAAGRRRAVAARRPW